LFRTITHSFRHHDSPISWLEGHEEEFLKTTLKAGIFRIIFDGLDEYVLRTSPNGAIRPGEAIEALLELSEATGARILVTSRTSFWNVNLPAEDLKEIAEGRKLFVYEIRPFDIQHARNYFANRLKDSAKVDQAIQLF